MYKPFAMQGAERITEKNCGFSVRDITKTPKEVLKSYFISPLPLRLQHWLSHPVLLHLKQMKHGVKLCNISCNNLCLARNVRQHSMFDQKLWATFYA
jgi:hypothetical protein